jgi:hypothetical protein
MNRAEAIKATNQGAIAAGISGLLTAVVYQIAVSTNATGDDALAYWNDHLLIFDIGLIFLCAFFIFKRSRIAAVTMLVYFILAKVVIGLETGSLGGIGISLVFLFFFGKAVWGAFAYHAIEKAENPDYKSTGIIVWILGGLGLALLVLLVGFGLMTMTGFMPSTEIKSGADLNQRHVDKLISGNIISSRDDIEYFYSAGLFSVLEEGIVLTNDQLMIYYDEDGDAVLDFYALDLDIITKIEMTEKGNALLDETYLISTDDPDNWLTISLSIENNGHIKFIEALKASTPRE